MYMGYVLGGDQTGYFVSGNKISVSERVGLKVVDQRIEASCSLKMFKLSSQLSSRDLTKSPYTICIRARIDFKCGI